MQNFKKLFPLLLTFNFFLISDFFAESYIVEETLKGPVFYQRLEWNSSGVVKEYKLFLEQKIDGTFCEIADFTTTDTFYDVSLDSGEYRFYVIFYNVLGQPAFKTDYKEFEIIAAHQPQVKLSSNISRFKNEEEFDGNFSVKGNDINAAAKIYLLETKSNTKIFPESVNFENDSISIKFDTDALEKGNYKLVIENPSGLKTESSVIKIRDYQKLFLESSLNYNPQVVFFDDLIPVYFEKRFLPANFNGTFSALYEIPEVGKFGAGLSIQEQLLKNKKENYTLYANLFSFDVNAIYERNLVDLNFGELILEVYGGAGLSFLGNLHFEYKDSTKSDSLDSILPCFDVGTNLKFLFKKHYFAQTGVSFVDAIAVKNADYTIGTLNFTLGGGVQF